MTRRRHGSGPDLPSVRVVGGGESWARPPLKARMNDAVDAVRPAAHDVLAVVFGMWPLFLVMALAIGLLWSAALGGSP